MKCIKCSSENLKIVQSGPGNKLVCAGCFAYQKFLSKADAKTFRQLIESQYQEGDYGEEGK